MIRNEKRETRWMTFFVPLYVPFLLVLFFDERHFPSLSLSLCLSLFDSVENERWRILGSTEVKRWILPSIFKFRIERRQTKGTNATNEKGETEAHGSRTLLPWLWSFLVITFFQFEGRTEESVATFPAIAHSPPPKKISFLSSDFPPLRVAFSYIFLLYDSF